MGVTRDTQEPPPLRKKKRNTEVSNVLRERENMFFCRYSGIPKDLFLLFVICHHVNVCSVLFLSSVFFSSVHSVLSYFFVYGIFPSHVFFFFPANISVSIFTLGIARPSWYPRLDHDPPGSVDTQS